MVAPTLLDYEYQYKDTGVKLNSSVSLPFVDVLSITGLDMAPVNVAESDLDGVHGGVFFAKFAGTRTVVFDVDIYSTSATADTYCESLISNFAPDDVDYPLYFKSAGIARRYLMAKSLGVKYNIDRLRAYGKTKGQIILGCSDPRKYSDNADVVMTAGTNYNVTNAGNINSFPTVTIVGAWTVINIINNTQVKTLTLTDTRSAGDVTVIDFRNRNVTVNGIRKSSIVTANNWFDIPAGSTNSLKFTVTGTPTSVTLATKNAWW